MDVFDLCAKISLDPSSYESALSDASKKTASFGEKLKSGLATAAKVGAAAITAVTGAATAMGAGAIKAAGDLASYGDNIDKMSQKLGMSAEAYQEWDAIMQHSGASIDSMQASMKTLSSKYESAIDVINKTSAAADELEAEFESGKTTLDEYNKKYYELYDSAYADIDAFHKLGFSMSELENTAGDTEQIFSLVVSKLQEMPEGAERTALAAELLGKGATELGALLNTSTEDTEAMRQRVHELGGVMSDEAVKAAAAYQDSLQDMQTAISGVSRGLISEFLPSVTTFMDGITELFSGNSDKGINLIEVGLETFLDNIEFVAQKVMGSGAKIIDALAAGIAQNLLWIVQYGADIVIHIISGIISYLPQLTDAAVKIVLMLIDGVLEQLPALAAAAVEIIKSLADGISEHLPELIPTIVDVVLQIVEILIENVDLLIDAAIAILVALAEGLINSIPVLLEKAPEIVAKLVDAVIENAPKLLGAALELILALAGGIVDNLPEIWNKGLEIIDNLIGGIGDKFEELKDKGQEIIDTVKDGIMQKIEDAKQWGKDMIQNFIDGIQEKWEALKQKVSGAAQMVKNFLGFSEPKEGPLSNFHTYAPDMMQLFAQGIADNAGIVQRQLDKSLNLDFGTASIGYAVNGTGTAGNAGNAAASAPVSAAQEIPVVFNVTNILDGKVIGESSYQYIINRQKAYGG